MIFDRGVPDVAAYLQLIGLPAPAHVRRAAEAYRYNHTVFVAPPWEEIFTHDAERKQTFTEAQATHEVVVETYRALGYNLVAVPLAEVEERVRFLANAVGCQWKNSLIATWRALAGSTKIIST